MIGSFLSRGLVMVLGYAYPAFECYKTVENNKPQIEELRFWCQYWILVAILTVTERIGDIFISWVPMYSEAKLAFYIYLWYPKTRGTSYVYDSFFKPYMEKHETEIDRSLLELRTKAGDVALTYWQRSASYVQTRIFDIVQFVATQSTLRRPRPTQPEQGPAKVRRTTSGTNRPTRNAQPETEEPPSPTSSTSSSQKSAEEEEVVPRATKTTPSAPTTSKTASSAQTAPSSPKPKRTFKPKPAASVSPLVAETSANTAVAASDAMLTEPTTVSSPKVSKDTVIEDTLPVTRAKLRKNRSTAGTGT